jgi:hypothetical protein
MSLCANFHHEGTARLSRNQSSKLHFTTEAQSAQSSEVFHVEFFLGVLRVSAVNSLFDRQTSHWRHLRKRRKLSSIGV